METIRLSSRWYRRFFITSIIVVISICSSGCWDRKELEERHFVLAVAIDSAELEDGRYISSVENFVQPHGNKRYRLSLQIMDLVPAQNDVSSFQGTQGGAPTYVISSTGESLFEIIRDMLGQVNRGLWFEHVQAIVISEAAVREGGLQPLIDFFSRDKEMRWLTKLLITSGKAASLLEYHPPDGDASGIFMANALRLYRKNAHLAGWHTDVGYSIQAMDNKSRVLVGRIELADDSAKLGGMGLFVGGQFKGYVDGYVTQGGKFLNGIEQSAIVTVECPEHPGKKISFELFRNDTKLEAHIDGEQIYYTLDIVMSGNLGEMQCTQWHDQMDAREIHKLETLVAEEVKRNTVEAFQIYQKLKVDADGFGKILKAHQPLIWEQVKDHWDEDVFPTVSLDITVRVVIENIGGHE